MEESFFDPIVEKIYIKGVITGKSML